jgi:hypothetical protein
MSKSTSEAYSGTDVGDQPVISGNDGTPEVPEPIEESVPSATALNNTPQLRSPAFNPRDEQSFNQNYHANSGQ